jgi:hypothetical protein
MTARQKADEGHAHGFFLAADTGFDSVFNLTELARRDDCNQIQEYTAFKRKGPAGSFPDVGQVVNPSWRTLQRAASSSLDASSAKDS